MLRQVILGGALLCAVGQASESGLNKLGWNNEDAAVWAEQLRKAFKVADEEHRQLRGTTLQEVTKQLEAEKTNVSELKARQKDLHRELQECQNRGPARRTTSTASLDTQIGSAGGEQRQLKWYKKFRSSRRAKKRSIRITKAKVARLQKCAQILSNKVEALEAELEQCQTLTAACDQCDACVNSDSSTSASCQRCLPKILVFLPILSSSEDQQVCTDCLIAAEKCGACAEVPPAEQCDPAACAEVTAAPGADTSCNNCQLAVREDENVCKPFVAAPDARTLLVRP